MLLAGNLERDLENQACQILAGNGWAYDRPSENKKQYNKQQALYISDVFDWLDISQQIKQEEWTKQDKQAFALKLAKQISSNGTMDLLKKGFDYQNVHYDMVQFRPSNRINTKLVSRYKRNIHRVTQQLYYSEQTTGSIDLVLFLNGLPVSTIELKSELAGQDVTNAIAQYKKDRSPKRESLLQNSLVHFAIDDNQIFSATELKGKNTRFFPFNDKTRDSTKYFWEDILDKTEWLNLIQNFLGQGDPSKFPRFNQYRAVNEAIKEVRELGLGNNYLFEHSPGAGKTMTINWLAHQLSTLHNDSGEKIVDTVIIVSDRNILDKQLGDAVDGGSGRDIVKKIKDKDGNKSQSVKFREAVGGGYKIIVVTSQTFLFIYEDEDFKKLADSYCFALIIDEAHSSQGGDTADKMRSILAGSPDKPSSSEDSDSGDLVETVISRQVKLASSKTISYFAFTATPKDFTLKVFGREGKSFDLYGLQEAENEKFVLPVLKQIRFFADGGKLVVNGAQYSDIEVEKAKTTTKIRNWLESNDEALKAKIIFAVEHFLKHAGNNLRGHSKMMFVCGSRLEAVKVKHLFDELKEAKGWDFGGLVAFSGEVEYLDQIHTEQSLNGFPSKAIADRLERKENRLLMVADKFQVGFDQPKLVGLFINKHLNEQANIVQTYSRVNRIAHEKYQTLIVDFINEPKVIYAAFDKYRDGTSLDDNLSSLDETLCGIRSIYGADVADTGPLHFKEMMITAAKKNRKPGHYDISPIIQVEAKKIAQTRQQLAQDAAAGSVAAENRLSEYSAGLALLNKFADLARIEIQSGQGGTSDSAVLDGSPESNGYRSDYFQGLAQVLRLQNRHIIAALDSGEAIDIETMISLEDYALVDRPEQLPTPESENDLTKNKADKQSTSLEKLIESINRNLPDMVGSKASRLAAELVHAVASDPVISNQAEVNDLRSFLDSPDLVKCITNVAQQVIGVDSDESLEIYKQFVKSDIRKIIGAAVHETVKAAHLKPIATV